MQADDEKAAGGAFFAAVTRLLSVCRSQRDAQISLDQSFENCVTQHVARVEPWCKLAADLGHVLSRGARLQRWDG